MIHKEGSEKKHGNLGKIRTEKTKQKIREIMKKLRRTHPSYTSSGYREKMREALKNRKLSEKTKRRLGERMRAMNLLREYRGSNNSNWKGGVKFVRGYKLLLIPDHPNADKAGYVREHVLMASKALGRPLKKGEIVHHVNGVKLDNRNRNFVICTQSYMKFLESVMVKLYMKEHFGAI